MSASATTRRLAELLGDLVFGVDVLDEAAAVRCPILVIHRRDNRLVDAASVRALAESIPDARLEELEGADHVWFFDDDGQVAERVGAFLRSLPGGVRRLARTQPPV
jgi:pimeloyl-ACP methyl ester carboxylesterase